jgi:hypothetical protein
MNYNDKVNGYQVIARIPEEPGSDLDVILVHRDDHYFEEWVTAIHRYGETSWYNGHYIGNEKEAWEDVMKRLRSSHPLKRNLVGI